MAKSNTIIVSNTEIAVTQLNNEDYICITDMAKAKEGESRAADIIKNWIRTRTTLEFLGTWEEMYNPSFNVVEFDHFRMQAGLPSFVLSAGQWIEKLMPLAFMSNRENTVERMHTKTLHLNLDQQSVLFSDFFSSKNFNGSKMKKLHA